ncbi:MAG: hypothetical protein IKY78_04155 [Clostridia bacterium]|nr:hypothetical protein [Clostridia bacterium]
MKKTLKKVLILFAIVTVIVTVCAFATSAAADCGAGNHTVYQIAHEPTCTDPGYIEYRCTMCNTYYERSGSTAPALGHKYASDNYVYEVEADGYKRGKVCTRTECAKTIYDTHIEGSEAKYDIYYLIKVINPYVTETYCADVTYTYLADTYRQEIISDGKDEDFGIWYIKKGETLESYLVALGYKSYTDWMNTVDYYSSVARLKDKTYGAYDLVGWAYSVLESDKWSEADIINFAKTKVTANDEIFAVFQGDETVTYRVQYRDGNAAYLTTIFDVRHGKAARDDIFLPVYDDNGEFVRYDNTKLEKADDIINYYEFSGWSPSREAVYDNIDIVAQYKAIPKEYEFVFYKWEGGKLVPSDVTAVVTYGGQLVYKNADGERLTDAELNELTSRDKDRSYIYSWDGGWQVLDRGLYINPNSVTVPYYAQDITHKGEDGYETIILVPTHVKRQVIYKSYVTIKFDSSVTFEGSTKEYDTETYLNGLNVQITDADGQLVAKGTANLVPGTDYAILECSLYDSTSYTVTVTSVRGKYSGSTTLSRTNVYDNNAPIQISVGLTVDEDYISGQGCKCICHNSLFKPIWVKVLNILYNLFNVKYVCCDDMYVSLGDLLAYTK